MKRILLLSMVFSFVFAFSSWAQRTVSGKVTDESGEGLPGVNVVIKGTTTGVTTDLDGNYQISVPDDNTVLVYSSVGMATQEVTVGARSVIDLGMSLDTKELQEVVVTGYSSVKRSDLTSAVSTIEADQIISQPIGSIDNLLQGNATGLIVSNQNGRPGGNAYIRIRGIGSVNATNEPLFIIDGIQMTQATYNAINPNDIENITVLKDAAATSIYGARASNGVVLINTKRGSKTGKPVITLKYQYGQKNLIPLNFELMNKQQKLDYEVAVGQRTQEEADDLAASLAAPETDWEEVLLRTAVVKQYDISIANSTDNANFFISLGHYGEDGISAGSKFERTSGRVNFDVNASEWLTFGSQVSFSTTYDNELRDRYNVQNPFYAFLTYNPYEPEFVLDDNGDFELDENGEKVYNLTHEGFSISEAIRNNPEFKRTNQVIGNVFLTARPIDGLSITTKFGGNFRNYQNEYYNQPGSVLDGYVGDPDAPGTKSDTESNRFLKNWTNTAQYDFKVGTSHNISAIVGTEFIDYDIQSINVQSKGFANKKLSTQDNAAEITGGNTQRDQYAMWSQFGQANYNYDERYLFSASLRRDGSSRFGNNNKYGTFWAVSAGWNITEEGFFPAADLFDQLKLRASYGTSGNIPSGFYTAVGLYGYGSYGNLSNSLPTQLQNDDLKWEQNTNFSVGLDFGVMNNRITGAVDYFNRTTSDLLFPNPVSVTTGFESRLENIGEMNNRGVELELRGDVIRGNDMSLSVFGSVSTVKNEMKEIVGDEIINASSGVSILREGLAANTFYLVRWAGVNPANGEELWYDIDGNITNSWSGDDAVALEGKSPLPKYYGNFGLEFQFKGLALNANFYYQGGNYIYNWANEAVLMSDGDNVSDQQRVDALNYWKEPGDVGVLPAPSVSNNTQDSDRYLQKGDFIRLRNVMLSYTLPKSITDRAKMNSMTVFVQGTNLWTHNPHVSGDPEVGDGNQESGLTLPGEFMLFTYPNSQGFSVGVNLTF